MHDYLRRAETLAETLGNHCGSGEYMPKGRLLLGNGRC